MYIHVGITERLQELRQLPAPGLAVAILYSTLLYSTLLYSTLLYSTLLYSTLLYSTLLYYKQITINNMLDYAQYTHCVHNIHYAIL